MSVSRGEGVPRAGGAGPAATARPAPGARPWHVFTFVVSALVIFLAGSTWIALFPGVPADLGGARDLDKHAEHARIAVGAGDHLDAWFIPPAPARAVVVIFHGYGRDHHRAWRYASFLIRAGYGVLAPDFRSSRTADRKPTTLGFYECEDARATLAWLEAEPRARGRRIAILGESLGGSVAIELAAERPEIGAVIADCPFESGDRALEDSFERWAHVPRWPAAPVAAVLAEGLTGHDPRRLDCMVAARRLTQRPLYLIASVNDDRLSTDQSRHLWQAAGAKDSLWVLADCGHNEAWQRHPREYERRVLGFLSGSLGDSAGRLAP